MDKMKRIYLNTLKPEEIIARLKNGEVIKNKQYNWFYKLVDGFICFNNGKEFSHIGCDLCFLDSDLYFEEEEKFEVNCTGLYRTRDGRKAFVSCIDDNMSSGVISGSGYVYRWETPTGNVVDVETQDDDLVGKWEE